MDVLRKRERDKSGARQGPLAVHWDREVQRSTQTDAERAQDKKKIKSGMWLTSMNDSLVKIRTELLHIVQGEMLPKALGPDSHLKESWLCCVLDILCPYCPSWPSSTPAGSGIQLCLHSSLSIAVTP